MLELLTIGRASVDLYPLQSGVPLKSVATFARSLGGAATNVAVSASRLGHQAGLLTKVGHDGFGEYVHDALARFGVDTSYVGASTDLRTPLAFCELNPPEDPPLTFYRAPMAPDLTLTKDDVPWTVVSEVPILWVTGTGMSADPARSTQLEIVASRGDLSSNSDRWTIFDLDWRPDLWSSVGEARAAYDALLDHANVAIGNRQEVQVAVDSDTPHEAARRLLARGIELAIVKLGHQGVLIATESGLSVVPPHPVEVVCGLGAGDAFGGALVHGLLSGWEVERCAAFANAAGAIVASRLACADAMPTVAEVEVALGDITPASGGPR